MIFTINVFKARIDLYVFKHSFNIWTYFFQPLPRISNWCHFREISPGVGFVIAVGILIVLGLVITIDVYLNSDVPLFSFFLDEI